jgi:hypothetical protein
LAAVLGVSLCYLLSVDTPEVPEVFHGR